MTASQIIDEIKSLTPEEQAGVVRFVYQLDAERKLSGAELSTLAERLINAEDPAEASRVRETIVRGFYGANLGSAGCSPAGLGSLPSRTLCPV
jgi:hypothetical protein